MSETFNKYFGDRTEEELKGMVKELDRAIKYKKLCENETTNKLQDKVNSLPMKNCPVALDLNLSCPKVKKEVYNYISYLKTFSKKELVSIFDDVGFVPNTTEIKYLLEKFGYNPEVDIRDVSKTKILEMAGIIYQIITAMKHAQVRQFKDDAEMLYDVEKYKHKEKEFFNSFS